MKITINAYVARAMVLAKLNVAQCQNALNAAIHDGTTVIESKEKITGASVNEKKMLFQLRESEGKLRQGKLTDPLRFIAWNVAFDAFTAKHGAPSGEITLDAVPVSHVTWLKAKFSGKKKTVKLNGMTVSRANKPAPASNGTHKPEPATVG